MRQHLSGTIQRLSEFKREYPHFFS
jgi:hypothetical protein